MNVTTFIVSIIVGPKVAKAASQSDIIKIKKKLPKPNLSPACNDCLE